MKLVTAILGFALSLVLFTTGCSSLFKRTPAQAIEKHKHYIMTLHGVRGNELSFGDFNELIKKHLEQVDPGYEVVPVLVSYSIGQTDYTPDHAAEEINAKLEKAVPNLDPKDKLSIVAYSMGGQAGMAWYYNSLKNPKYKKYAEQTDKFISLGGAYWGAKEPALFTSDIEVLRSTLKLLVLEIGKGLRNGTSEYIGTTAASWLESFQKKESDQFFLKQIDRLQSVEDMKKFYDGYILPVAKISFAELQALSIGSVVPTNLRLNAITKPTATKWVSISGLVQCFETDIGAKTAGCDDFQNPLFSFINKSVNATYTFGLVRRETDNAVITPSSIAQFIYATDPLPDYKNGAVVPSSAFRYSIQPNQHKIYFAETLHATLVTRGIYERSNSILSRLGGSWSGITEDLVLVYKAQCENPSNCNHPVYKYIVDELANCDRENSTCDKNGYNDVVGKLLKNTDEVATTQDRLRSELHGFTIDINLRLPKGYALSKIDSANIMNYIKADYDETDSNDRVLKSSELSPYKIHLARPLEIASRVVKKVTQYSDQDQLKVNLTGLIEAKAGQTYNYKDLERGMTVSFTVALPGLKTRRVDALVRPYYSTFVDLKMAP